MPNAVLKLTNKFLLNAAAFSSSSSSSSSCTAVKSAAAIRWFPPRIKPCVTTAHLRTTAPTSHSLHHIHRRAITGGLRNQNPYSSQSENRSNEDRNHLVTPIGATLDSAKSTRSQQSEPPSSKLLTLPTVLTIGRVGAVPLLVGTFYVDCWWGPMATSGIFVAAAVTDWLDGYLARKMKLGTPFGAFLDPVADKLIVAATLVLLCTRPSEAGIFDQAPWLLTVPAIAIIGREITMSAVREWAASQDKKLLEAVAVNNLGKWKTATQMTALTILLATRDSSLVGMTSFVASGVVLLYISAWLAVWSLAVYMRKMWKVLLR